MGTHSPIASPPRDRRNAPRDVEKAICPAARSHRRLASIDEMKAWLSIVPNVGIRRSALRELHHLLLPPVA